MVYERLGVGGMATVHRARERGIEGFERIVALKRLLPHLAEDASFIKAFVREAKLASMLEMGVNRPWQEALEKIAGTRQMDASAIRDYFAPLQKWLDEQNKGKPVGW